MAFELTEEQRAAVENRGGTLLVSAAAGSGKTRVLVERLMGYVEEGRDIDRFLVITFTNAAAAELRERISAAIQSRLALHPEDRHLRRSAARVYQARICTVDAFCLDFLRQWGHLAGLDPDFRVCDEAEGDELRAQALKDVLERRYAGIQADPAFAALVDALAGERDDQTIEDAVLDVHSRVQAQPDPRRWLLDRRGDFDLPADAGPEDSVWGRLLLADGAELTGHWLAELEALRGEIAGDDLLERCYGPSLDGTLAGLEDLRLALDAGWDAAAACFPVPFPRLGTKKGECDEALKDRAKALRDRCKKQLAKLGERFEVTAAQAMEDLRAVGPAMAALLEVAEEFDRAFETLKRRRHLIDFADAEHLTARLLAGAEPGSEGLAADVGAAFDEIMVDEYQDTNTVQNAIFDALSNGRNLFLVGDVKQSIYRFRLADPTIFLDKYVRFPSHDRAAEGEGRSILLSRNFRSRPEVLDGVNFIFRAVMSRQAGELDYTDAEALIPGREDLTPAEPFRVELNCLELGDVGEENDDGAERPEKDLLEARAAAARIRTLLDEGFPVGDRPLRAEDVVILLRSPGTVLRHYGAALDEQGIPWTAGGGREFFGTTEISVAVSLLSIIDNPRQDVPLLAVLRSPLFRFGPDRLAALRREGPGCVYDSLAAGAARGEPDCAAFLTLLDELRELAAEESSHVLLRQVYDRTDLPAVFAGLPDGARRRANLMALYDEACRFEGAGHRGLMAFLLHLSRMADNNVPVPVAGGEGGGVRILSIHRSKGLEFPVVLLCGLERRFNETDSRAPILFHPELGLGPKRTDRARMLRYTTIARDAVALRLRRQMRAEEMRLLYVAMTRAEHKLILFTALRSGENGAAAALADRAACPVSPWEAANAACMADWILPPVAARGDCGPLYCGGTARSAYPWNVRVLPAADYCTGPAGAETEETAGEALSLPEDLQQVLAWTYPHAGAADIPSKLTATQLKGRQKDAEAAENAVPLRPAAPELTLPKPWFDGPRPLTAAQRGTALHMVMQYLDYSRTGDGAQVADEIARLTAGRYITPQQGEAVDPADILAFFRSDLGRRLLAARQVEREYKFSLLVPAADYYPGAEPGEEVLLQGVVDCWFVEADGSVTVLDFKTDRVTVDTLPARSESYRPQLDAYTRALAAVTDRPVARRALWFFSVARAVEL